MNRRFTWLLALVAIVAVVSISFIFFRAPRATYSNRQSSQPITIDTAKPARLPVEAGDRTPSEIFPYLAAPQ